LCGQACIAMIAEVSLDEACTAVGHGHSTTTKDIVQGLRRLGLSCTDRLVRVRHNQIPPYCIVKQPWFESSNWHWIVVWNEKLLDPDAAPERPPAAGRPFTSYLPIWRE